METPAVKPRCPKCNMANLEYRTPRAFWVKVFLFWYPVRRYKCGYCHKKTYLYGAPKAGAENKLEVIRPDND